MICSISSCYGDAVGLLGTCLTCWAWSPDSGDDNQPVPGFKDQRASGMNYVFFLLCC